MRTLNSSAVSVTKRLQTLIAMSLLVGLVHTTPALADDSDAPKADAPKTGSATVIDTKDDSTAVVETKSTATDFNVKGSSDKPKSDAAAAAESEAAIAKEQALVPKDGNVTVAPASSKKNLEVTSRATYEDFMKFKSKSKVVHPKIGLALGGGGARGAAHVGVLEVLLKEGIKFDFITGTSIGSVVGGMHAAGVPMDKIQTDFESGALMKHFMTVSLPTRIMLAPILYMPRLLGAKPYDGLYNGAKFRNYLDKNLPTDAKKIEELKTPFAAVALNVLDGKPYMLRGGELGYAMQASCAVPGLRKPVQIGEKLFVDGGVVCNLPVKQCRQMGADIVIAVNIDEPFYEDKLETFRKPGSVTRRMLKWDLYTIDGPQEDIADVVIHPNTEDVSLITTSKSLARRAFEEGQKAAREALPEIRKRLGNVELVNKEDKGS
ncbi:MAG TPA: patatin-like phospholipase family protein [Drouetiella sp.]